MSGALDIQLNAAFVGASAGVRSEIALIPLHPAKAVITANPRMYFLNSMMYLYALDNK